MGFAFGKMEQQGPSLRSLISLILLFVLLLRAAGNPEGDALYELKKSLVDDPNNVLQSWDATLVSPCTWFHITCNSENSVIRVDLGNANLSGQLVPQLRHLPSLQYLYVIFIFTSNS
ncbi:hypothetical protein F2Q70_00029746 [Brassica cretica]|uniref:Leucine-rich repeat-containing N-terminal plant-type domain-containing protein n=1 Tax=Brassica cretica TaxID=69181 RepID=A0A8S9FIQ6_BRACR|nr:hypothetical protein F2Q70_00029746 [Brassica cretica]